MKLQRHCLSAFIQPIEAALRLAALALLLLLVLAPGLCGSVAAAQKTPAPAANKAETRITPAQAKQLFSLVDELIQFSSSESGLPVKSAVKRKLITRAEVQTYLQQKFDDDQSAKRLQQDEILLKKFGLLDRDFQLRPFLLALLTEQIEAFYDEKTKTVNLLDWVDIDEQKPVMAHELTHALQDQHVGLEKWGDQTPTEVSSTSSADLDHIARDEWDTAREAVTEGQATAVMMDYILKPLGKSLVKNPEVMEVLGQQMNGGGDSPVMARAPLLLSESMLFPYREGISFEQDIWMDLGREAAFAGTLDHPPASTWEIMNPREYEQQHPAPVPLLPNIHALVDKLYDPYDIGQIGELDLSILVKLLGGDAAAARLAPAWHGGLYWAGQQKSACTPAERASTASLALFYLSSWRNEASAEAFAKLYAGNLGAKYGHVEALPVEDTGRETVRAFSTSEGPVRIVTRGKLVFVSESFPEPLSRQLASLLLDSQRTGETLLAGGVLQPPPSQTLTSGLVRLFGRCGVLKDVVRAGRNAALQP